MFYESIAKVYDYIFPKNRKQLEFVESIKKISSEEKILDIGCATGNLTELLREKTRNVVGIDLDKELLKEAKFKLPNLKFEEMNMLKIDERFEENSFDLVLSLGLYKEYNRYNYINKTIVNVLHKYYCISFDFVLSLWLCKIYKRTEKFVKRVTISYSCVSNLHLSIQEYNGSDDILSDSVVVHLKDSLNT